MTRKPWAHKASRHERGYGSAWVRLRKQVMARDRWLCQACLEGGRYTEATEVDHITPKARGGDDSLTNLRAICTRCHAEKTARESGRPLRPVIGIDGWPKG